MEISEGDSLLLRCQVAGTPEISMSWFKAGGKLRESSVCSLGFASGVATLKLSKTTKFDRGEYICTAENRVGSASASCYVTVKGDCLSLSLFSCMLHLSEPGPKHRHPGHILYPPIVF